MRQLSLTPAAGKRLIGKAIAKHSEVLNALKGGTVVVIAGTTNSYVAEELLAIIGQSKDFRRDHFFRGIVLPPATRKRKMDGLPMKAVSPVMW